MPRKISLTDEQFAQATAKKPEAPRPTHQDFVKEFNQHNGSPFTHTAVEVTSPQPLDPRNPFAAMFAELDKMPQKNTATLVAVECHKIPEWLWISASWHSHFVQNLECNLRIGETLFKMTRVLHGPGSREYALDSNGRYIFNQEQRGAMIEISYTRCEHPGKNCIHSVVGPYPDEVEDY